MAPAYVSAVITCQYYLTSQFYCEHRVRAGGFDGGVNCAHERFDIKLNSG